MLIDFTRSRFDAVMWIWTEHTPPAVGVFVSWCEGRLVETSHPGSTFLGIVLYTHNLVELKDDAETHEVVIVLDGDVRTTMYNASQDWTPETARTRQHHHHDGALHVWKDRPPHGLIPVPIEVTSGPGTNNPYVCVRLNRSQHLPQDLLDDRCGVRRCTDP